MNRPPILNIKMVPAGVELVLRALNKLPREESDGLYEEILSQYMDQMRPVFNEEPAEAEPTQQDTE